MAWLSLVPTLVLTVVWLLARRRVVRDRPPGTRRREETPACRAAAARRRPQARLLVRRASPAAGRAAGRAAHPAVSVGAAPSDQDLGPYVDTDFHVELARVLDEAEYPYDEAVVRLGFDKPAIKVASLEGDRATFRWTLDFEDHFHGLLDREIDLP